MVNEPLLVLNCPGYWSILVLTVRIGLGELTMLGVVVTEVKATDP